MTLSNETKTQNAFSFIPEEFHGKVILVVNIARKCGYTPQLEGLEKLYKEYKDRGFEILAYPSDDFNQEPLSTEAVVEFCQSQFGASFRIMPKCHVKGNDKHPFFAWLGNKNRNGKSRFVPLWNFHKYLIDREGQLVDYFFTPTKPESNRVKKGINRLL